MRRLLDIALVLLVLLVVPASARRLRYPQLPPLPAVPVDPANPPTATKRTLGTALFFDARLSGSGTTACTNCHVYNTHFQDNLVKPRPDTSRGQDFFTLKSNTESLLNIAHRKWFFRDGRLKDLGRAMTEPWIEDNQQLGKTRDEAAAHLATILRGKPGYVALFRRAFGKDIDTLADGDVFDLAGKALAVFVRQIVTKPTPFDRWNAYDGTIPEAAERGVALFVGKGGCVGCHFGSNFSDDQFHNVSTSLPVNGVRPDEGRGRVTGVEHDRGAFLTPTLRQVTMTSPYFHDGSALTLIDVINHLDAHAGDDPNHDAAVGPPLGLTDQEKADLLAFFHTLRAPSTILRGPTGPLCNDAAVAALRAQLPN